MRDLFATMPDIKDLYLIESVVSDAARPTLQHGTSPIPEMPMSGLILTTRNDDDWNP